MQRFFPSFFLLGLGMLSLASTGTSQSAVVADSIPTTDQDSIQSHQKEVQEMLQKQLLEMTRFPLGSTVETWSHSLDMEVTRGGRTHVQRFWFNPKKNGSMIWLPDSTKSNECLFYDPETDRLASLFPSNSNGTLISSAMALKMGLKGNTTATVSKRASTWISVPSDSLQIVALNDGKSTIQVALGKKSSWQADGVNNWLSMQPIPGFSLPPEASKQPIVSFEQTSPDGRVLYRFRLLQTGPLETPFTLDLSAIRVDDPTRPLAVIAKEWAAQNKANQESQEKDTTED
jgi:hypothetical protein